MRSAIVGGPGSALHSVRCRLCRQSTKLGQAVLHDQLNIPGYRDGRYVIHVECVRAAADRAPEGLPVRTAHNEFLEMRRRAETLAANGYSTPRS